MLIRNEVIGSFLLPAFYYQFTDSKATNFQYSVFNYLNHVLRGLME